MVWCSSGGAFDFYPRSPCGERRYWSGVPLVGRSISIHALLAESDIEVNNPVAALTSISIHALLAESDISCAWSASKLGDFYPRSPCGERPTDMTKRLTELRISIHALLAESDSAKSTPEEAKRYFYPRSPCGERPVAVGQGTGQYTISIHALLAESDPGCRLL